MRGKSPSAQIQAWSVTFHPHWTIAFSSDHQEMQQKDLVIFHLEGSRLSLLDDIYGNRQQGIIFQKNTV